MDFRIDIEEEGKRRAVPVTANELTIGRGSDNSIVINDPRSSRHHCRLVRTPQGVLLEDMESRNGTILNGVPVKKSLIKPGALFSIGSVRFRLLDGDSDDAAPEPPAGENEGPEPSLEAAIEGPEEVSLEDDSPELNLEAPAQEAEEPPAPALSAPKASVEPAAKRPAPAAKAAKPAARNGAKAESRTVYFERVDKGKVVERIPIDKPSVVIGRGKDCDIVIDDKRASTRHARIVSEGGAFFVEDLGSTNGTLLNNRAVKRAILARGASILIGNTTLRAVLPAHPAGAARSESSGSAGQASASSEELIAFDAEKFLERDRSQHPAAVLVLVAILAVVAYFTVDITRRLVRREDLDPRSDANRIVNNWSFESSAGKTEKDAPGQGAVPGWKLSPGDKGEMRISSDHAQQPGRGAMTLRSKGDEDICRASYETDLVLDAGRDYVLDGYAVNQGAFAAGLVVEWLRPSKEGVVVVGRSYSDTARQAGEAVDIAQTVTAPAAASQARVSCFVIGPSGAATFDRVSFSAAPPPNATNPAVPTATEKTLRVGAPEDPVGVALRAEGTFAIQRKLRPLVTALWAGLAPDEDPQSYGPRLTSLRPSEGGAAAFTSEVPDEKGGRWVTVEARAAVSGQDVQFEWRTAVSENQAAKSLCLYFELRDKSVPVEAHRGAGEGAADTAGQAVAIPAEAAPAALEGTFKDIVVGEREDRVSLVFSQPVKLSTIKHPLDPTRRLLVAECPAAGIDVTLAHGSRHEASLAHTLALKAEESFRAGRAGEAIQLLSSMKAQYPEEKMEVRKAEERISELRNAAEAEVKDLEAQFAILRQTPTQVVEKLLLERAELVRSRYQGTPEGTAAAGVLDDVKKLWSSLEARSAQEELQAIHELARKHFAAGELGLAELYYRWLAEGDKEGALKHEAETVLKTIEGRRARDRNILLQ